MQSIPLEAKPSQTLKVTLDSQYVQLNIYTLPDGLFLDLLLNGTTVIQGALCVDRARLVREAYLGFSGDLMFIDTQGKLDPYYTDLGGRWQLIYLNANEL